MRAAFFENVLLLLLLPSPTTRRRMLFAMNAVEPNNLHSPSHFRTRNSGHTFRANRAVMQPFLEARFTPGIVDGGERGSSKGLGPLLDELLAYVKEVRGCLRARVCARLSSRACLRFAVC